MLRRRAGLRQELLLPGQLDDLHAALRLASAPSLVRAQVLARLCWALKPGGPLRGVRAAWP